MAFALLAVPAAQAGSCPVEAELANAAMLSPNVTDRLLARVAPLDPGLCADELLTAVLEQNSPAFIDGVVRAVSGWPSDLAEPWLFDAWAASWFRPGARREDVLMPVTHALEARLGQRDVLLEMTNGSLGADWTRRARDRYIKEWSAGLAIQPPPFDEAFGSETRRRWRACVAEPASAPADPFDPLGLRGGLFGQLGLSARCASHAVLGAWNESQDPAWSEFVREMVWQYSASHSTLTDLAASLEQRWGQGLRSEAGEPIQPPSEPRPQDPLRAGLIAYGALVLASLLLSGPRRTRRIGFPGLAIAFGLGLLGLAELILRAQGVETDPNQRPGEPLALGSLVDDGTERWLHDERGRSFPLAKPPGVARIAVLGASSVAGPGLASSESIPRQLARLLGPEVPCLEVINLGRHGADSPVFRSWALKAVQELSLDGVVLYGGHNEVAGTREAHRYLDLGAPDLRRRSALSQLALWGALQRALKKPAPLPALSPAQRERGQALSDRDYGQYLPAFDATVTARAELEFNDLARGLRRTETPLVLAIPSFNHHGLRVARPAAEESNTEVQHTMEKLAEGDAVGGLAEAEALVASGEQFPVSWALLSLARELSGDLTGAEEAIWHCARRNHLGSAVTPGVVDAIREAALEHGVLADTHGALHVAAGPHLPGYDLFVDYVHLNPRGAEVVAIELARAARDAGYVTDWAARCLDR